MEVAGIIASHGWADDGKCFEAMDVVVALFRGENCD